MAEACALLEVEKAFGRAFPRNDEGAVALVDVGSDEAGAFGIRAGNDDCRDNADVGGKTRGIQAAFMLACGNKNFAAQMAAFLFGRKLVLEVDGGGTRFDI